MRGGRRRIIFLLSIVQYNYLSEGREVVGGLAKVCTNLQESESGGKVVNRFIKVLAKMQEEQGGGERVNRKIEV